MDLTRRIYEGDRPYLFISYAHKDSDTVLPIIQGMMDRGIRVWFDAGTEPVGLWQHYIADHLVGSHGVVIMLSANSLESHNCRKEILMAGNRQKNVCVVYLEPLKLSPGDEMQLIDYQALYRWKYGNGGDFLDALCRGSVMDACRADSAAVTVEEVVEPIPVTYETIDEPVTAPAVPGRDPAEAYMEAQIFYDKRDYNHAANHARIAAEQGHPGAQYLLGIICCHFDGYRYCADPGISREQAKQIGHKWIRMAAENGYPQAQRYVGEMEKDPETAAQWFRRAADRGDTLGLYYLGECYRQGKGLEKDIVKAMDCYLAAHKKHPVSASRYKEVLKKATFSEKMALKKAGHNLSRLEK